MAALSVDTLAPVCGPTTLGTSLERRPNLSRCNRDRVNHPVISSVHHAIGLLLSAGGVHLHSAL
eukprot:609313-Amphidinium_carterae.1